MQKAKELIALGEKNSFFIVETKSVQKRIALWRQMLPSAEIFFSVKSCPDTQVLRCMMHEGTSFDCASMQEIELMMGLGCAPTRLIFAHPVKDRSHILLAKSKGVKTMTFDSAEEAVKISELFPEAELILRIDVGLTDAPSPMSKKFGATPKNWIPILKKCHEINMRVRGVSFHVGTGGVSFQPYKASIDNAEMIFKEAAKLGMKPMDILDIGGGFSTVAHNPANNFENVAPLIEGYLKKKRAGFLKGVKIIGEPGRVIAQESFSLVTRIILARQEDERTRHYFVNNGVYQGCGARIFDGDHFAGQPLLEPEELAKRMSNLQISYVWG